jgi:hypothetical protein
MRRRIFMTKSVRAALMGAALAGFVAGSSAVAVGQQMPTGKTTNQAGDKAGKTAKDTHSCKGQNSCKGKGGCKAGDNGCKGKNSCKGKGGCATDGSKPPA